MPDMSSPSDYGASMRDPGETLGFLERLIQRQPQNSSGSDGIPRQGTATSSFASARPAKNQSSFDPDFRQLMRTPSTQEQSIAGSSSIPGRSEARVADAANDNYARDAQCTTASYDCLSHSWDADYAAACRKAYLLCLKAGGYAQQSGTTVLFNFPDRGRVILYGDGTSRYIPSTNPPQK
jgi:hypothetical protein